MKQNEDAAHLWNAVDDFLSSSLLEPDPVLDAALEKSAAAGLPSIQVSPCQGRFLQILAEIQNARRILEIGTLGGYSTIWLARALAPGGRVTTLEVNRTYAEVASANLQSAGLSALVDLRVGPALEILPKLAAESCDPFDFIFIDADKPSTPDYFLWALKLSRRGTLIVVDNVIRAGALADATSTDAAVQGMRKFTRLLGAETRVRATAIQTVGTKGYDGFALAVVKEEPSRKT